MYDKRTGMITPRFKWRIRSRSVAVVMLRALLVITLLAGATFASDSDGCNLSDELLQEIRAYQPVVNRILDEIVQGRFAGETWKALAELTDNFGARMTGSQSLEDAIDYAVQGMKDDGLENVHTEEAAVPHWIRGYERAQLVEPMRKEIAIIGLGTSVGTRKGGITAEVVVVESFEELESLPEELVKGKIVVYAQPWQNYGVTGQYRGYGASAAAKKGAVASLIRSVTQFSIGSAHTGVQEYEEGVRKIPTACITVEDSEMMLRKYRRGEKLKIHLEMNDRNLKPFISRNTVGELVGSVEKNTSVVVVSGHLDSWDVGVGAMDDGGGVMISWKALTFLKAMGLRPRRTIRAILFTGEEQGLWGGQRYYDDHKDHGEEEFSFFFEADIGTFNPRGFDFAGNDEAACIFQEIVKLMAPLNTTEFRRTSNSGPDVAIWNEAGFPGAAIINDNERYFWFHHSAGDSMLVEDPVSLDKCAAIWAAAAYVVADLSVPMPKVVVRN